MSTYTTNEARTGIYETFYQHWISADGWASITDLSTEPKVVFENIISEPSGGVVEEADTSEHWVRVQVRHNESEMSSFGEDGEGRFQAVGIATMQVFSPLDQSGLIIHDQLVNVCRRAFRGKRGYDEYCGIVFRRARINEIGPDGRWFASNVLVDFEYDEDA